MKTQNSGKQMMDSKMSAAALIIINNTARDLVTFISFILFCILYSFIITLQDFYSWFRRVFHLLLHLRPDFCKRSEHVSVNNSVPSQDDEARHVIKISRDDVELVMKQLRLLPYDQEQLSQDCFEIADVFDRSEPSLDEVREAFRMFDENNDGFVDAGELRKVMSSLGLVGLSEQECERMIMVFDDDGDGRISFGEFVKLIEENVCC